MRLALDAMGGDHAPQPIVAGALEALHANPNLHLTLVGDSEAIGELVPSDAPAERLRIVHTTQVVGMAESPVDAIRGKPDSSISGCWKLLADKEVDGVVSAGNTGAMVAGGLRSRRFLPNVRRPGICAFMPTAKGLSLVVDVGANVAPKPSHLYQYGVMGLIFARHFFNKPNPTVGLLNIGEEAGKGNELTQRAYVLLKNGLKDHFVGNIEGRDVHQGVCDVIVTDGFVGNVILKLSEGVLDFLMHSIVKQVIGPLPNDQEFAMKALKKLIAEYDYTSFGGGPLLGVDGACVICHGSSKEVAIRNALAFGAKFVESKINEKIVQELEQLPQPKDDE
ncbi:MAG: phosphate acyltransferase PlsX [Zavarzinella sp.]